MAFARKVEHLRRDAHRLQGCKKLEAFADIEPVIEVPMNHQRRRLEIFCRIARVPLLVHFRIGVRRSLELPVVEPKLFSSSPGGKSIEHAVMGDDALEAVSVAEY